MSGSAKPRAKNHHQVPQFYLSAFANANGQIRAHDRLSGAEYTTSIRNVAAEQNLYTIDGADGEPSDEVEQYFSNLEGSFADTWNKLHDPAPKLDEEDRVWVARFLALQFVRTSENRRMLADASDTLVRLMVEGNVGGSDREQIEKFVAEQFSDASVSMRARIFRTAENPEIPFDIINEEWLDTAIPTSFQIAPFLLHRRWRLADSPDRAFVTSDSPVVLNGHDDPLHGVGIATARTIVIPVSSYRLLELGEPSDDTDVEMITPPSEWVREANRVVANTSIRQVLFEPADDFSPLAGITLSARPRIRWINGHVVESHERAYDKIRDEMASSMHRGQDGLGQTSETVSGDEE